jgi:hypothetical protein
VQNQGVETMLRRTFAAAITVFFLTFQSSYPQAFIDEPVNTSMKPANPSKPFPSNKSHSPTSKADKRTNTSKADKRTKFTLENNIPPAVLTSKISADFALRVQVDPRVPIRSKALYESISSTVTSQKIPPSQARIDFFRSHYNSNSAEVIGWEAMLYSVESSAGGYLITVRVTAKHDGQTDSLYCLEKYHIANGKFELINIDAPQHQPRLIMGY